MRNLWALWADSDRGQASGLTQQSRMLSLQTWDCRQWGLCPLGPGQSTDLGVQAKAGTQKKGRVGRAGRVPGRRSRA